jgi:hypothetical protein
MAEPLRREFPPRPSPAAPHPITPAAAEPLPAASSTPSARSPQTPKLASRARTPEPAPSPAAQAIAAPASYLLPSIPYVRLRFWLAAARPFRLPELPGSMLRGAFGNALRRAACTMGAAQSCATCRLRRVCLYTRLFENFLEEPTPPFLHGLPTPPRPYVLEAPSGERTLAAGEAFPFELVLLGAATSLTAYALFAVERMGGAGLGWPRTPFTLERAEVFTGNRAWRTIFAGGEIRASGPLPVHGTLAAEASMSRAGAEPGAGAAPQRVRLTFLTPTRLKGGGRFLTHPTARDLAFAILLRTLEVAHFHVPEAPLAPLDWSFRPVLEAAQRLALPASRLRWKTFARYSNRQKRSLPLGGFLGELELEGDLAPLLPLLDTARILHVGKGTTIGLGRMEWESLG